MSQVPQSVEYQSYLDAQKNEDQLKQIANMAVLSLLVMGCMVLVIASLLFACSSYVVDEMSGLGSAGKTFAATGLMISISLIGIGAFGMTQIGKIDIIKTPTPAAFVTPVP